MSARLPIEAKWPIVDRSKLQLFSLNTPNGIKVAVALEELGLPYEPHLVRLGQNEQFTPEFISISPNAKIPAILDLNGPGNQPLSLMESGAILIYLAEKAGRLIPSDPARRYQCLQWLFFQVGHIGPMFGQFGHFFKYAKDKCKDPYPVERYTNEAKRLLSVLERQLSDREYLVDEYSIADIATFPWVSGLSASYQGDAVLGLASYEHVQAWLARCKARPAYERGKDVTSSK
ncbi:MAG TPA: glutathione S-transferase N-terminal domain-containing protein [Polyangiaceae bacterium]|jgi:GST-like protein|nr:glutathione S-transferase N-terminal domain-containing protein [Polyangiaceae bacterium]